MRLMIFYPGGVNYGCVSDDATDNEIAEIIKLATEEEQGNGNSKIRKKETCKEA